METRVELILGMTVYISSQEYVVAGVQESWNFEGKSANVALLEPLYAAQNKRDQVARRKHSEEVLRLLPKVEALADDAMKGEEWKEG